MYDWLMLPLSGAADHQIAPWAYWHARFMVLGWGILLPCGVLVARYFKVTPGQDWPRTLDNKAWWHGHQWLQWSGVLVMSVGAVIAWNQGTATHLAARLHGGAGWVLVALGWFQVAAAIARGTRGGPGEPQMRGDHYDMTAHRIRFERLHKSLGWLAVVSALLVITLGLWVADAPRWMAVVLVAWWTGLGLAAMRWQRMGRCIDTYQAIWGPEMRHPGNHIRPTGWGVRRSVPFRPTHKV